MIIYKLIAILCVIAFIVYKKLKKIYSTWETKGVKGPKPNWLVGNMMSVIRHRQDETMNTLTKQLYDMYPNERVVGMYQHMTPTLIVKDPALIRNILVRDFASFSDRGLKMNEKLMENVFLQHGETWKVYRQKLNPLFSVGTMRDMMPNAVKHIEEYLEYIENLPDGPQELSTLDHKLSVKLVMSNAFGVTVDSYNDVGDAGQYKKVGFDILRLKIRDIIYTMLHGYIPGLPNAIGLRLASPEVTQFVEMLMNKSLKAKEDNPHRETSTFDFLLKLNEQGVVIKEKEHGSIKVDISESLQAHALLFYVAGFEAFASASFLLYELALHQHVQERCYTEIVQVMDKYNSNLTLEALQELQYVNMAFDEIIRKYPFGGSLMRVATKDYHFEDINLTIEKGTKIIVPTLAIQNDPKYFPNPEVFDPERFLPENRKMIQTCSYLPFGDGPRKCIGYRLGRFQAVLMVALFLHRFRVTPCEKTEPKLRLAPYQFSMGAKYGLWVNITKRQYY